MFNFQIENSTKIILKVFFVLLVFGFLWVVRDILIILIMSIILASAMDPMVDYFSERKIPRAVSVLTVYVLVLGCGGFILSLILPAALDQLFSLLQNFPDYAFLLEEKLGTNFFTHASFVDFVKSFITSGNENGFFSKTFGVFSGFFSFLTILVISFYLVAEEKGMKNFIATLLPVKHQESAVSLIEKIQKKMGLWVLGQFILSVSIFVLTLIGLLIVGFVSGGGLDNVLVQNALVLALFSGMLEVMPYIGPFLSAIPAVVVAFTVSPPLALVVLLLYVLIQKFEGYVLVPKVMQKTVGASPIVVLISLLVGFKLAGILGLLIAVPVVSAITVVINESK